MESIFKYSALYKANNFSQPAQEERRKQILDRQKEQRFGTQDSLRNLKEFIREVRDTVRTKKYRKYKTDHRLQLSEWLRGKPQDMERWFLVPCPKGQRCLLIATEGRTEMYNKRGSFMYAFKSNLPGSATESSHYTVLDCVYVKKSSTFYVLDVIAYSNIDMLFCEAQFRFFWLKAKFSENPELEVSDCDKYRFVPLKFYDFENAEDISSCLIRYPQFNENHFELDGFLFYHKEASYVYGETPVVGWLFAFMIPEVLHLEVHKEYMKEMPIDYTDFLDYMTKFDKSLNEKRRLGRRKVKVKNVNGDTEDDMLVDILEGEKELEIHGERIDDTSDDMYEGIE